MKIFSLADVVDGLHDVDHGVDCSVEPSLTQQQFKDDCDINRIMAAYSKTGILPAGQFNREEVFGDATAFDFQRSMDLVARGSSAFESLDPVVRREFDNDPVKLLEAFNDPNSIGRLEKVGLVKRKAQEIPPAPAAPAAPPAAPAAPPAAPAAPPASPAV